MDVEQQIKEALEATKKQIQGNMEREGINASGRTSLSMRVVQDGTKIRLVGGGDSQAWGGRTAPIETLEIGRGPGGDYKRLRPIIVRWTVEKGFRITASSAKEEESKRWAISTIIAKNIVENGTRRTREPKDVYSTPVNECAPKIRSILISGLNQIFHEIVSGTKLQTIKTNF